MMRIAGDIGGQNCHKIPAMRAQVCARIIGKGNLNQHFIYALEADIFHLVEKLAADLWIHKIILLHLRLALTGDECTHNVYVLTFFTGHDNRRCFALISDFC